MFKIKAILIDVDGTLVRSDRTISDRVIQTINKARNEGVIVSLCTGRPSISLKTIFDWIGWQGVHVVAGGAQVFSAQEKKTIWSQEMNSGDVKWLHDNVDKLGGDLVIQRNESLYGYKEFLQRMLEHPWEIVANPIDSLKDDWSSPLVSVHQVNNDVDQFLQTQDRLHAVKMTTSQGVTYYDVTAPGVSKITAIEQWAKICDLELSQIAGMGDGENDLEFLSGIGMPMVMENAVPELLEKFDTVLPSNNDDGVAVGIEKVLN